MLREQPNMIPTTYRGLETMRGEGLQKTVLMITYPYYPANASGAHRPVAFSKYLPLYGWTPVVVCKAYTSKGDPQTYDLALAATRDVCEVVRVHSIQGRFGKRLQDYAWGLLGGGRNDYRNPFVLYVRMKQVAEQIIRRRQVDALWSTFSPGLDHAIASYLSRRYNVPWIADFRDLPDQSWQNRNTRHIVQQEKRVCLHAKAVVGSTEDLSAKLRQRHRAPVYTILNGFDPDDYADKKRHPELDQRFTINHFGVLHSYRNPAVLFQALDTLAERGVIDLTDIQIGFYGEHAGTVSTFAQGYRCVSQVKIPDRLDYHAMIARQRSSQVLLLITGHQQGGAIPAKLYGYLASQRPVLNVPGDGRGSDRILRETGAGISSDKPACVAAWLESAYHAWKNTGRVPFRGKASAIEKYSRKIQTRQLATILDEVCGQTDIPLDWVHTASERGLCRR